MNETPQEKFERLRPKPSETRALVEQSIALYDAISNTNSAVVEPLADIYSTLMKHRFTLERMRSTGELV